MSPRAPFFLIFLQHGSSFPPVSHYERAVKISHTRTKPLLLSVWVWGWPFRHKFISASTPKRLRDAQWPSQ
jgi:hypothetical protein